MATTTDLPSGLLRRSDPVAYLVRSFQTNARIRSLTTGTFNRVVKDRIAFRLSGAPSVLGGSTRMRIRLSSKPFNHIVRAKPRQPAHPTAFTHDFHMRKLLRTGSWPVLWKSGPLGPRQHSTSTKGFSPRRAWTLRRATIWPSALDKQNTDESAHAEAEDRKLIKELALEVLALKVPFRNLLVFPNQVPWPGRLRTLHSLKT